VTIAIGFLVGQSSSQSLSSGNSLNKARIISESSSFFRKLALSAQPTNAKYLVINNATLGFFPSTYDPIKPVNDLVDFDNAPQAFLVSSILSRALFVFKARSRRIGPWMKLSVIANFVALKSNAYFLMNFKRSIVHIATNMIVGMI